MRRASWSLVGDEYLLGIVIIKEQNWRKTIVGTRKESVGAEGAVNINLNKRPFKTQIVTETKPMTSKEPWVRFALIRDQRGNNPEELLWTPVSSRLSNMSPSSSSRAMDASTLNLIKHLNPFRSNDRHFGSVTSCRHSQSRKKSESWCSRKWWIQLSRGVIDASVKAAFGGVDARRAFFTAADYLTFTWTSPPHCVQRSPPPSPLPSPPLGK